MTENEGFSLDKILKDLSSSSGLQDGSDVSEIERNKILKKIKKIKNQLIAFHEKKYKFKTTKEQGDLLEEYMELIFELNKGYVNACKNIRTSDNEIDFIVYLKEKGKIFRAAKIIPSYIPDDFIFECKNYKKKLDITFINKFYSVLNNKPYELGILVSYSGITGDNKKSWYAGLGFVKKINLLALHIEKRPYLFFADEKRIRILEQSDYNIFKWIENLKNETKEDVLQGF